MVVEGMMEGAEGRERHSQPVKDETVVDPKANSLAGTA